MQRADAGKTAARRNHGKGGVVPALEHEDAGVTFARVAVFVGFGINLAKHCLAPRPLPQTVDDLQHHRLIGLRLRHDDGTLLPWKLTVDGERREYRPAAQVVVNQGRKQAALAHLGITQVSLQLVADELARGALVEVLPACAMQYQPLYAYYPNRKGHPAALLQVLTAIREE